MWISWIYFLLLTSLREREGERTERREGLGGETLTDTSCSLCVCVCVCVCYQDWHVNARKQFLLTSWFPLSPSSLPHPTPTLHAIENTHTHTYIHTHTLCTTHPHRITHMHWRYLGGWNYIGRFEWWWNMSTAQLTVYRIGLPLKTYERNRALTSTWNVEKIVQLESGKAAVHKTCMSLQYILIVHTVSH